MKKLFSILLASFLYMGSQAQISITNFASPYTQNFDSLSNDTLVANGPHIINIAGWTIFEKGTGGAADDKYVVNHGASNAGNAYSYGSVGIGERALGTLGSGTNLPHVGCTFENNTGQTIASMNVSYKVEQWRLADSVAVDTLIFEYSTTATGIDDTNAVWTTDPVLTAHTPNLMAGTGANDGNLAANQASKTATVNVTVNIGSKLYIRWRDVNVGGSDDGLAVDDLSVSFIPTNNNKPILTAVAPADGATNVPVALTTMAAKFDKNIAVGSGQATLVNVTDATNQTILAASCVATGDTGIIMGFTLIAQKDYVVMFDSTLFTTVGGVYNSYGIYDNTTWNFDTKSPNAIRDFSGSTAGVFFNGLQGANTLFNIVMPRAAQVNIETLDMYGKRISAESKQLQTGTNMISIDHNALSSGVYFLRVSNEGIRGSVKFVR